MRNTFNKKLIEWYRPGTRNLPWKNTQDPYKIWLSEIILQQTRVEQGMPYYLSFIKKFPTVKVLANAHLDSILKLWEGLGYYSRARNLHVAAREVMNIHGGKFPAQYPGIRALKGIGDYTAAAIASFAYDQPYAVVDGNVYRVLSRVFGIEWPIDSTAGKKHFQELAQQLLDKKKPGIYNQAMMDFGSLVCKPKNPECGNCPFNSQCIAFNSGRIYEFPVKAKAAAKKERHFHYFVLSDGKHTLIRQRTEKDIWEKLFEFPLLESTKASIPAYLKTHLKKLPKPVEFRQVLTHRVIHGYFYEISIKDLKQIQIADSQRIALKDIGRYAFPKIINLYLQERLKCLS